MKFDKDYVTQTPDIDEVDPIIDNILNEWSYNTFDSLDNVSYT